MPVQTPTQRAAAYAAANVPMPYTAASPTAPAAITADTLSNPPTPLTMPAPTASPTTPPDYYMNIIKSVPTVEALTGQKNASQLDALAVRDNTTKQMLDVLSKMSGKTGAQQSAEAAAGVPDLEKQLTDVNAQIKTLQNEASAIPLQEQNNAEGRGITAAGLAPIQAADLRTNAIKALGLSSIASTLQGNLTLAQQQADRAVAAEFDPLQGELDYLKQIYTLNQDTLSEADKEQADRISAMLTDRQDQIAQAKADRTSVYGMVSTAMQNGAPATVASSALSLSLPDATKLLDPYIKQQADWGAPYLLGGDYVQKNAKTGEIRTAVNIPAGGASGGGGGGGGTTFSSTQLNKGAANAGMSINDFKTLDNDTKNWFINSYSTFATQQKLVQQGQRTAQEVATDVQNSSSIPAAVKPVLLNILGVASADASTGGGGGGNNFVGGLFGGALHALGNFFGIQ